jgi:hypothetical protein
MQPDRLSLLGLDAQEGSGQEDEPGHQPPGTPTAMEDGKTPR